MRPIDRPYWTVIETLAWIMFRRDSAVERATDSEWNHLDLALQSAFAEHQPDKALDRCQIDIKDAEVDFRDAIQAGNLTLFGRLNGTGQRLAIPASEAVTISLHGDEFVRAEAPRVSAPWWSDLLTDRRAVIARWPVANKLKRGPKPKYDSKKFIETAVDCLEHHGGFDPTDPDLPNQAALEKYMTNWCDQNWTEAPAETWVRNYVRAAIKHFEDQKFHV